MTCLERGHWEKHEGNRLSQAGRRLEAIDLSGRGGTHKERPEGCRGLILNVSKSELGEVGKGNLW